MNKIRQDLQSLEIGERKYIGPCKSSGVIYSEISRSRKLGHIPEKSSFKIRRIYAIDAGFDKIYDDIYEIRRER